MRELGDLRLHCLDDGRGCVTNIGDGNTSTHVDELVAIDVDQDAATGTVDVDRQHARYALAHCCYTACL